MCQNKVVDKILSINMRNMCCNARYVQLYSVLLLAVLDPRVGHTMDVLSPFISVLCRSD